MGRRCHGKMYLHTKVDNEGAQALFTRRVRGTRRRQGGADADADRAAGDQGGPLAALGGWWRLGTSSSQELNAKDYA